MTDPPERVTVARCETCGTVWGLQDDPGNCYVCADDEGIGWRHGPATNPATFIDPEQIAAELDARAKELWADGKREKAAGAKQFGMSLQDQSIGMTKAVARIRSRAES